VFQVVSEIRRHLPALKADHGVRGSDITEVMGADDFPDVTERIDKEGPIEELDPVQNEIILYPRPVLLGVFDRVKKIPASTQKVPGIRVDSKRKVLLAHSRTFRHLDAVTFDNGRKLIEREVGRQSKINRNSSFGVDWTNGIV
jgi:hypothetical protein